ncbi:MAG: helix-turn-helix domain-containing protein [Pseudomonadota bacterium]
MSHDLALLQLFINSLIAIFLLSIRSGNLVSNRILAFYFVIFNLDISNFVFINFYSEHLNLEMLRNNVSALLAPTLYLYVRSVLHTDFSFKARDWAHALPFIIVIITFIPRFYLVEDAALKLRINNNLQPLFEIVFVHILQYIQMAIYLGLIFITIRRNRLTILNAYSDELKLNKQWLSHFMTFFMMSFALALIRNVVKFTKFQSALEVITPIMMLAGLGFSCWILWQALNKPELFKGISSQLEAVIFPAGNKKISTEQAVAILAKLESHMHSQKPFLNPTLNIDTLAEEVDIAAQDISLALNHHLGRHFFDFINGYRIEAACEMLASPDCSEKTVLDISLESGFNSKSSFNTAFKKQMHLTPSQYRQQGKHYQ